MPHRRSLRKSQEDAEAEREADALIRSLQERGIGKDHNVYAAMGAVWNARNR